mgnify:CR=1 FL=1
MLLGGVHVGVGSNEKVKDKLENFNVLMRSCQHREKYVNIKEWGLMPLVGTHLSVCSIHTMYTYFHRED